MSPADGAAARVGAAEGLGATELADPDGRERGTTPPMRQRRPPSRSGGVPHTGDRVRPGGAHQFDPAAPVLADPVAEPLGDRYRRGRTDVDRTELNRRSLDARPAGDRVQPPVTARPGVRGGIRLNGPWCVALLILGVGAVLLASGSFGWQPGVPVTIGLAAVGVGVALLAGRGGAFEAGVLPGTVVIVVGAVVAGADPGALGGAVAGLGGFSRVWQIIGLLAPAAAVTWVCALVTLVLRRSSVVRPF